MTDTLPRHIADMVGVVFGPPKSSAPKIKQDDGRTKSPISMVSNADGTFTIMRYRKVVGWITPVHLAGDIDGYKALSIHGDLKNCYSMRLAREFLLSSYH